LTSLDGSPYLVCGVPAAPGFLRPPPGGAAVPIYEFQCQKCGKEFNLVLSVKQYEQKGFACPACQAKEVEQLVSSTNVITSRKS
jgi:putative FmdB family regulatory protein